MQSKGAGRPQHRRFSEIRRPMTAERRARIDAIKEGMAAAERLAELRAAAGFTQVQLADRLGVSQGNIAQLEGRSDLFLSTLRGYVEALGGELQVSAVFPDQTYDVVLGSSDNPIRSSRGAVRA